MKQVLTDAIEGLRSLNRFELLLIGFVEISWATLGARVWINDSRHYHSGLGTVVAALALMSVLAASVPLGFAYLKKSGPNIAWLRHRDDPTSNAAVAFALSWVLLGATTILSIGYWISLWTEG